MGMLSFEITAIDIILSLSVIVMLVLYMKKVSWIPDKPLNLQLNGRNLQQEKIEYFSESDQTMCPRGFGNIKKLGKDSSVSEKCLGCYNIMECYNKND